LLLAQAFSQPLKDSPTYILQAFALSFLAEAILAQQPTPILPDPKLSRVTHST
jgi:hypothetical protein